MTETTRDTNQPTSGEQTDGPPSKGLRRTRTASANVRLYEEEKTALQRERELWGEGTTEGDIIRAALGAWFAGKPDLGWPQG